MNLTERHGIKKSIQRQVPEGYKYIHGAIESIQNTLVKQQLQLKV